MALVEMDFMNGSGSETKMLAYAKNGGNQTAITDYYNDPEYTSMSADHKTVTFLKDCSGIMGLQPDYITYTVTGTLSITGITIDNGYTDDFYSFTASAGDTITFSSSYWWGYELIGS